MTIEEVRNLIKQAPSWNEIRKASISFLRNVYGKDSAEGDRVDREPECVLTMHAGVMNAGSARAKKLSRLADAIFSETGLPRKPEGKYRGLNGLDKTNIVYPPKCWNCGTLTSELTQYRPGVKLCNKCFGGRQTADQNSR